jgi:putative peptidoglycan lipid II flippase
MIMERGLRPKSLAYSAIGVALAALLGRIFGFIREMVIAAQFGATAQTDAYLVAYRIPNLIYGLLVYGALTAAFIPVFTENLVKNRVEAWRIASNIFNLVLLVSVTISLALIVFSPWAIVIMASGFTPETTALSASLLRLMAPAIILMCLAGVITGILHSHQKFLAPSLVAFANNLVVVLAILFLAVKVSIFAVAIGVVIGGLVQVLIQLPSLLSHWHRYYFSFSVRHPAVKKIGQLFLPVALGIALVQLGQFVDSQIASWLAPGSLSALNFAYRLSMLPLNTFVAAVIIVLFPKLSRQAAEKDFKSMQETIALGIRAIAFLVIPAAIGLFVLHIPITKLLFERGAFTPAATLATASALRAYALGLLAVGVYLFLTRAFYALKDALTPLKYAALFLVSLVVVDLTLVRALKHVALALGYSTAMTLIALGLINRLKAKVGQLSYRLLVKSLAQMTFSALVMGIVVKITTTLLSNFLIISIKFNQLMLVAFSITIGLIVYLTTLFILKNDDVRIAWHTIASKVLSYYARA